MGIEGSAGRFATDGIRVTTFLGTANNPIGDPPALPGRLSKG